MTPSLQQLSSPGASTRHWLRGPPLGSGSFGAVFLGLRLDDNLVMAVKSAPLPTSSVDPDFSLLNELLILQELDSPRVIRCLGADFSIFDRSPSFNLFLEYMPGGTIADLIKRSGGKLDETTAAACVRGILEGLSYLHRKSIVHCDIKAKNILLGPAGEIKIADFGSAKRLSSSQNPEDRRIRGTPLWMAPEVLQGVEQETPSDIWSLGCTVIEMLHGRLPWQDKEGRITSKDIPLLLMRIACSKEISPPLKSSLSEQARDFLNRCLVRDPSERWTAEQLLQHPFVKIRETSCWGHDSQPSPRSAFDFVSDSDSESESEGESESFVVIPAHDTVPSCHLGRHKQANINDDSFVKDCSRVWHVMRCADNWLAEKQKPFFCSGEKLVFKKGSDVSFESVSFLTKRVRSMRMS